MKKLFSIAIALLIIGFVASSAFAAADVTAYGGGTGVGTLRSVTTINTGGTYDRTNISATAYVIPSKCVIVGYNVAVLGANSEGVGSIVDATSSSTGNADTQIIGESEATIVYPRSVMFPSPLRVSRGLRIDQGPGTVVTVFYVQDRP